MTATVCCLLPEVLLFGQHDYLLCIYAALLDSISAVRLNGGSSN